MRNLVLALVVVIGRSLGGTETTEDEDEDERGGGCEVVLRWHSG